MGIALQQHFPREIEKNVKAFFTTEEYNKHREARLLAMRAMYYNYSIYVTVRCL